MITALLFVLGCSEYQVYEPPVLPPAEPPGVPPAAIGAPPDWATCTLGYAGHYINLTPEDMGVAPPDSGTGDELNYDSLNWWATSRPQVQDFDPSLDKGSNWWPVDDGIAGDPAYFAAWWVVWIKASAATEGTFTLGAATDVWVYLDNKLVGSQSGRTELVAETFAVSLRGGQYPIVIYAAQRGGPQSALRFRWLTGDVKLCYPDFSAQVTGEE